MPDKQPTPPTPNPKENNPPNPAPASEPTPYRDFSKSRGINYPKKPEQGRGESEENYTARVQLYKRRLARRDKPFRELSLGEMIEEYHDSTIDLDSTIDDHAWTDRATMHDYILQRIVQVLLDSGIAR